LGTQKQKAYEEGIQKIQTQIDNISGLDIVKDGHKAYLQSKMNELGNRLKSVASGDFSNFQLVNSVSGMTKQVASDPIIQNAVASTAKFRKEQSNMEADIKEGKSSPENQWDFNINANNWFQSDDLKEGF
jgi:hypothetical protein